MSRIKSQHPGLSVPQGPPLTTVPCMGLTPLPQPHWTSFFPHSHLSSHSAPLLRLFPLQKCPPPSAMPAMAKLQIFKVQPLRHILWNVSWLPQTELMLPLLYFPIVLSIAFTQPSTTPHSVSSGPLCVGGPVLSIVMSPWHSVLPGTAATERMLAE